MSKLRTISGIKVEGFDFITVGERCGVTRIDVRTYPERGTWYRVYDRWNSFTEFNSRYVVEVTYDFEDVQNDRN
jgi:hypothetical protein